jgi:uncharacterized protein
MKPSKRILITGASGLLGTRLTSLLEERGHEVLHLSRSRGRGKQKTFLWDVTKQTIEDGAFDGVDVIVHLAGAAVVEKRWSAARKKEIIDSRVQSTALLYKELKSRRHNVQAFVSASAIGYYGFTSPETFTESGSPGTDFLAQVTALWEQEADKIAGLNIRLVKMRIGVVLAKNGGALKPIADTVRWNIGAPLGSGNQFISWVHEDDICLMFVHAIENQEMRGPYNGVAPQPVTNRDLTKAVASVLNKPLILPNVPAFALKIALGEMSAIVVNGSKVSADKIINAGYTFRYPILQDALENLLKG